MGWQRLCWQENSLFRVSLNLGTPTSDSCFSCCGFRRGSQARSPVSTPASGSDISSLCPSGEELM